MDLEFKGTKGEWTFSPQIGIKNHCFQAQVWNKEGLSLAYLNSTDDEKEATYNAKLIASAPDLLQALQSAFKYELRNYDDRVEYLKIVNKAIEKALK